MLIKLEATLVVEEKTLDEAEKNVARQKCPKAIKLST